MNQDDVYQKLEEIYKCKKSFTLIFSGKKSKVKNGFYRPGTFEITINNKNFLDQENQLNESLLMYTAMHELAHHIQFTEHGQKGTRCHTQLFYAIMDMLADKAEEKGIYKPVIDGELEELLTEAEVLSNKIARLQIDLGKVLGKIETACFKKGVRYEDMIKRKALICMDTAKKYSRMACLDLPKDISADIQEAIASERDNDKRRAMTAAAQAGKSFAQVKHVGTSSSSTKNNKGESEMENLLHEKKRLENTINNLQQRLKEVIKQINKMDYYCQAQRK